jgi:beta-glucanase (GH16 family)
MGGGGNWEFEWYVNNRTNSYVRDSVLYILPTLTEDAIGLDTLNSGDVNIWGGAPADVCTSNAFYGCERNAAGSGNVNNPVRSARLRSVNSFSFQYGRVEISAKLPRGDWLWPAIWMLPTLNEFGTWPASGEIDILESRGNDESYSAGGCNMFGSTLHWGADWSCNREYLTHADYDNTVGLDEDFHTYGLYWDADQLYTYFDDETNVVLKVDFTTEDMWTRGEFPASMQNPWVGEDNSAPFNREFYILMNIAVGGTNGYFPDDVGGKPWADSDPHAPNAFWNANGDWTQTWVGEGAALQVDSVKVWSFDAATGEETLVQK